MATEIWTIDHPGHHLKQFDQENLALIIDENVYRHFGDHFAPFSKIIIAPGEMQKNLQTVEMILSFLMDSGLDRKATITGIGGGVVCDITGFAASIYLRGVDFGFLPSTLLAMCDAAVGGKNGINFHAAKNMVGVTRQPQFIGYYLPFLESLPGREYISGMAEVVKHAFLEGQGFIDYLINNQENIIRKDPSVLKEMIGRSYTLKNKFVVADLLEKHERKKLNLGHTLGHAIELASDLCHGESVSIGLCLAAKISNRMGICNEITVDQLTETLKLFDLPVSHDIDHEILFRNLNYDKKRQLAEIDFIMPVEPGRVEIVPLSLEELHQHLKEIAHG